MQDAFYQIAYPCRSIDDLVPNLERFYPPERVQAILASYPPLAANASVNDIDRLQGRVSRPTLLLMSADIQILADVQVHLPVRLLATDLAAHEFPVVRYTIETVAKALRTGGESEGRDWPDTSGKVIHGSDLPIHQLQLSILSPEEATVARAFKKALKQAILPALGPSTDAFVNRGEEKVLILTADGRSVWGVDWRWIRLRAVEQVIRA